MVGAAPTETGKTPEVDAQLLDIEIPIFPETAFSPHVVVILFVPCPAVIVTPVGTVHVYVKPA